MARLVYPALFVLAGFSFFILPLIPTHKALPLAPDTVFTGSNTFTCESENQIFDKPDLLSADLSHNKNVFYLNLHIGEGREDHITFVIKDEEITETAFVLDDPTKRYLTFLYHGRECTYSSDEYHSGMLMIHKYDTVNQIIAGSFEFIAYSSDCNELVRLNHGTFRATYVLI